jgi:2-polyprenyl-3-methyl-5-hydroxy-6-metoxy-1,4-benzoquinol methylase
MTKLLAACCFCQNSEFKTVFEYHEPPVREVKFDHSKTSKYYREMRKCTRCGHFYSVHDIDLSRLYDEDYVSSTYGSQLFATFNRINALDPAKSDNVGRVKRVTEFVNSSLGISKNPRSVLDIGSGLCVFLFRMKQVGWDCTALDPDARSVEHAQKVVGVNAVKGDFMVTDHGLGTYDLISFNKVLEHVLDPIAMLKRSHQFLKPGGMVYFEVPDGECAQRDGSDREEFFIDHHHVFSMASTTLLAYHSGFTVRMAERLKEPSTKYTIRTFLSL